MQYKDLLEEMIETPSLSGNEGDVATLLSSFLQDKGVDVNRSDNNIWAYNRYFDESKRTILLCSHIDTVSPNGGYTKDPYSAITEGDKLFGLGSNDAGASVVALVALFIHFFDKKGLKYNLCLALVAEEERIGKKGVESILPDIGTIDFAIVGEPTCMCMAIAERGLMVLDCLVIGKSGHAAHDNTINPIYLAMKDIEWFSGYKFEKTSPVLGAVKMNVTVIESGNSHNVVPSECRFTVDVRSNECYSHAEILETVSANVKCIITPRSTRLKPSSIDVGHPIVVVADRLGIELFGSQTLSDQALLPFPSVKIGVGNSLRSHTADEYVLISELESGIATYIDILELLLLEVSSKNK